MPKIDRHAKNTMSLHRASKLASAKAGASLASSRTPKPSAFWQRFPLNNLFKMPSNWFAPPVKLALLQTLVQRDARGGSQSNQPIDIEILVEIQTE
jgi:hypothetical protein